MGGSLSHGCLVPCNAVDHTEHLFKPAQRAVAVPSLPSGREESGCCLAWSIAKECADTVQSEQLLQLHHQITLQASYFQAKVLAMDATNGVLSGGKADSMTRMGQLLSRWALSQQPPLLLHLGVDLGMLAPMNLPVSGTQAWHGPCAVGAKLLMSSSRRPGMVHMSSAVKEQLSALRFASMILGRSSSFYLDAFTEVLDEEATTPPLSSENGSEKMRFEDFSAMLGKQVDLSRFGKGAAKTVRQFYQEVVEEENSYLEVNGSLRRHVELVRISLRVRCPWGKQRELRIKCVVSPDGSRERNRPLAMALRDGDTWRRAVQRCFQNFGLEPDLQQLCFSIDQQAYSYEETVADSRTVPGIPTAYKTHKIVIMVKNPSKAELSCLGLPEGTDFTTQGEEERHWTWAEVTQAKGEEELLRLLQLHGVDCSDPRSFCELHEEVYEKRLSRLQVVSNELVRQVRVVKVWLCAFILNCKHVLIVKTKQKEGGAADGHGLRTLSMRMDAGQDWEVALRDALWKRLGIPEQLQREELYCHLAAQTQEVEYSRSFPGLKTTYDIFEVHCEVLHPQDQRWQGIGLPGALDFTYLRKDQVAGQMEAVVTRWSWCEASRSITAAAASLKLSSTEGDDKGQVLPPEILPVRGSSELLVSRVMEGRAADWPRARRAAELIRSPEYSTRDFYNDVVAAFPELRLYSVVRVNDRRNDLVMSTSANRSGADEFQRTIGALFCIFWLMRTHLDGKECFCFGLNSEWQSGMEELRQLPEEETQFKRRMNFYTNANWGAIEDLFRGAGLLRPEGGHDTERTLAMLVLMTIHDIMKLDILRPSVLAEEFCGYKPGDVIGDHDLALSYVLERCPEALPSFAGLLPELQESIRFTHCKLDYNMGWLVQGEAHPGALFRAFRKVILSHEKARSQLDVAFYFVYWFADLAGAEASPLTGCEKFVLKFPLHVLSSFIDSFPVVWKLGPHTETEVLENYLIWRWGSLPANLGPPPKGAGAIAKLRLVLMAQGDSFEVMRQFKQLPKSDATILSKELAITGCQGQHFLCDDSRESRGPAILVYYAPALMQKAGRKDPLGALRILAEVLRKARVLWPLNEREAEKTVLVRIDVLKELEVSEILDPAGGAQFMLVRNSLHDGQVKLGFEHEGSSEVLRFGRDRFLPKPRHHSLPMPSFLSFATKSA
ncbi:unnamed protein product [Effrenium voratum]|nr:unnamed protein product [Effrenium voratum]